MSNRRTPRSQVKVAEPDVPRPDVARAEVPPQPRFTPHPPPPPVARPYVPAPAVPVREVPAAPRTPARAVIGDELRIPMLWCELGLCINRHSDPGALGMRDLRDKAYAAGWRYDALGRLACPSCVQENSDFRPSRAPVPRRRLR